MGPSQLSQTIFENNFKKYTDPYTLKTYTKIANDEIVVKQENLSVVYSKDDLQKMNPVSTLIIEKPVQKAPEKMIPAPCIKSLLGPPSSFVDVIDSDCESTVSEKTNESFYESLEKANHRHYNN